MTSQPPVRPAERKRRPAIVLGVMAASVVVGVIVRTITSSGIGNLANTLTPIPASSERASIATLVQVPIGDATVSKSVEHDAGVPAGGAPSAKWTAGDADRGAALSGNSVGGGFSTGDFGLGGIGQGSRAGTSVIPVGSLEKASPGPVEMAGDSMPKPIFRNGGFDSISGRLPAEAIQRIVRQNMGRFRQCYETALRAQPKLSGRVAVAFEIGPDGSVNEPRVADSNVPQAVGSCIAGAFRALAFPEPEGGIVHVVYPFRLTPD